MISLVLTGHVSFSFFSNYRQREPTTNKFLIDVLSRALFGLIAVTKDATDAAGQSSFGVAPKIAGMNCCRMYRIYRCNMM